MAKADAALKKAINDSNFAAAERAIKDGANLETKGAEQATALMRFAGSTLWAIDKKNGPGQCVKQVEMLLAAGANVNAKVSDGRTVLHHAVKAGAPGVIKVLLDHGADPNVQATQFKYTPLHKAAERGRANIVRWLLESGADPMIKDNSGRTPMECAGKADVKALLQLARSGKLSAKTKTPASPVRSKAPTALLTFLKTQAKELSGKAIGRLPGYTSDTKLVVRFVSTPSTKMLEENDIDPLAFPTIFPIATLKGEAQFLAVDGSKPALPVLMWEHETGKFEPLAKSLADLVKRLS